MNKSLLFDGVDEGLTRDIYTYLTSGGTRFQGPFPFFVDGDNRAADVKQERKRG